LQPGEWVPWVSAAVVGMVLVLGTVVFGLHRREKVSVEWWGWFEMLMRIGGR
jgi:hypothetical protein